MLSTVSNILIFLWCTHEGRDWQLQFVASRVDVKEIRRIGHKEMIKYVQVASMKITLDEYTQKYTQRLVRTDPDQQWKITERLAASKNWAQ